MVNPFINDIKIRKNHSFKIEGPLSEQILENFF